MKVHLQYGRNGLDVELPFSQVNVLQPKFIPGFADEQAKFIKSCRKPIDSPPLKELIKAEDRVAVVIPDGTRAMPSDRLLPWLFTELEHIPSQNFTIILGTGTHRPNTPEEILQIVGPQIVENFRIINHNAFVKSHKIVPLNLTKVS